MNHIVAGSGAQGYSREQISRIPTCSRGGDGIPRVLGVVDGRENLNTALACLIKESVS